MASMGDEYVNEVGMAHRKRYAQYFTPEAIARFMSGWALGGKRREALFDPAFGLGAFAEGVPSSVAMSGMEKDDRVLNYYRKHVVGCHQNVELGDYLLSFGRRYGNIVCNPPYLKFQHFEDKERVLEQLRVHYGIKLSGYTNIASAFLAKALCELEPDGRLAFIMPSEFLNAGYGSPVKELLVSGGHLAAVIRVDCEQEAFPDALTSLCILLYDSAERHDSLRFWKISSLTELPRVLEGEPIHSVPWGDIRADEKWTAYLNPRASSSVRHVNLVSLATYGHFSRGIATGANDFFVLSKSSIAAWKLSSSDYSPCITKSAQIGKPIFTREDFEVLADTDAPVYLFNAEGVLSDAAAAYVKYGEANGYDRGYITRNRTPWFKMEHRAPAPIMLNVFSRQGYKVVRNVSDVRTLTSFHCFYPNLFGQSHIDALFLYLLSGVGHEILASSMRRYGNGLDKFEPNDLNQALVPSDEFLGSISAETKSGLLARLERGDAISNEVDGIFAPLLT